jgi:hypothetical protein
LPGLDDLLRLLRHVPSRQCRHAAARWSEAGLAGQESGHCADVRLYRRGAGRDDPHGDARRPQGGYLGTKAAVSRGPCDPAAAYFIRCQTTPFGLSGCKASMASAQVSTERCFL